jgi:hypothetical protein
MLIAQGSIKKQEEEIDRLRKIQKVSFCHTFRILYPVYVLITKQVSKLGQIRVLLNWEILILLCWKRSEYSSFCAWKIEVKTIAAILRNRG